MYDCSDDNESSFQKSSKESSEDDKKDHDVIDVAIKSVIDQFLQHANSLLAETQKCE